MGQSESSTPRHCNLFLSKILTNCNIAILIIDQFQLHGTFRRKDRVYTEEIFYGKGKAFSEVSADVLANDLAERKSENPHLYRSNQNETNISDLELKLK